MNELTKLKILAIMQRKALKNIVSDSQVLMLGILWFLTSLFAFGGVDGKFVFFAWFCALYTIYRLFENAMNAAEVGL